MSKSRTNVLCPMTKVTLLSWWSSKTRMSLNRKEVTKKLLAPHIHDIRPTQYLLKMQVFIVLYHCCAFAFLIL
jgi:hypothetical protein